MQNPGKGRVGPPGPPGKQGPAGPKGSKGKKGKRPKDQRKNENCTGESLFTFFASSACALHSL